jgi:hypothetical protein
MWAKLREHKLAGRVLLVAVMVGVVHLFDWNWLRGFTVDSLMQISAVLGIPMLRHSFDVIRVAGINAKFEVACTLIDAYFGAIPLLWRTTISWPRNLLRMVALMGGMFVLNIVRLEFGFAALTRGVPWWLAHEVVSGVTYFLIYIFIVRQHAWDQSRTASYHIQLQPSLNSTI